jgi:putative flippase GtrA
VRSQRVEEPFTTEDTESTEGINGRRDGRTGAGSMMRWVKFNAVGAVGMLVQLGALAVLNRWMPGRYLVSTALAIEITLLHNFFGHVRFTWRDRCDLGLVGSLVRFHLSNGLVSMVGNLALMPLLVGLVGMPVLVGNGVAILACSVVNFWLGDGWVFAEQRHFVR